MKKLADILLKRSLLFIVLIFTVSIVGVYTFLTIDQREIPETEVNLINVITAWPGANKDDIEENITNIIETEIFSIEGIEEALQFQKIMLQSLHFLSVTAALRIMCSMM